MRKYLLYFAILFIVLCLPIRGNETEVRWLWEGHIWVPISFLLFSLICIGSFLYQDERIKVSDSD